jgi:hypothetical protein
VHHHLDLFGGEDTGECSLVAEIALVKGHIWSYGIAVAVDEVVEHDRAVPGCAELADAMTADVSGTTYD